MSDQPSAPQPSPTSVVVHQYVPRPEPRGLSTASMVLGILGLFLDLLVLGLLSIVAVVLGHLALKREPAGRGMAIAGLVTGYLGLAIMVVIVVVLLISLVLPLIFVGAALGTGTSY